LCENEKEYSDSILEGNYKAMSFEDLLLEAVDDGLASLAGPVKQAIYYHLEKTFNINIKDIPYKIEEFTTAIEKIFGIGAKILQIQIMKCLYKKVGYTFKSYQEPANLEFIEYVTAVKLAKNNCGNIRENPRLTA
jgi:hypothetical protein